ncbi:hypothetical protein AB0478_00320 [Streptomyces sp. NPDC051917]|uniref:hypothetical protein n=1 Tax=Streptomyces sp. NPDC051917 TaxID=3154754 RepID=UPI00344B2B94
MSENEVVRELLWKAAATVPVPESRGSEAVFVRASRLRRRRRAAVTGALAAVVAGGVALGSGVLPGGDGQSVAASPTAGEFGGGAAGFAKLLPRDVGKVREVSLLRLIKGVPKAPLPKDVGPYDGDYAIAREDGVGYVTVRVMTAKGVQADRDPCKIGNVTPPVLKCTNEKVPGGLLSIWLTPAQKLTQPSYYGAELQARLLRKDGSVLFVRDWTGFLGQGSQGPVLKTFPLTRAQLRELALRPQLLP